MNASDYFNKYYAAAKKASDATDIPALLILAQSALETAWGKTTPGNMFFGIKAGANWKGKRQKLWTHEVRNGVSARVQADFRAYNSPEESFVDWANFLKANSRYKKVLAARDTVTAAKELEKAGYATDPNYAESIIMVAHKLSPSAISAKDYAEAVASRTKVAISSPGGKVGIIALFLLGAAGLYWKMQAS